MTVPKMVPVRRPRQAVRKVQRPQRERVPAEQQPEPKRELARAEALEPVLVPERALVPERVLELPRRPGLQQP